MSECRSERAGRVGPNVPCGWTLAADGLRFSAAPVFAAMALIAMLAGPRPANMLCGSAGDLWPPSGMGPMYLLMSAVHSAPWLRRFARARGARRASAGPSD